MYSYTKESNKTYKRLFCIQWLLQSKFHEIQLLPFHVNSKFLYLFFKLNSAETRRRDNPIKNDLKKTKSVLNSLTVRYFNWVYSNNQNWIRNLRIIQSYFRQNFFYKIGSWKGCDEDKKDWSIFYDWIWCYRSITIKLGSWLPADLTQFIFPSSLFSFPCLLRLSSQCIIAPTPLWLMYPLVLVPSVSRNGKNKQWF